MEDRYLEEAARLALEGVHTGQGGPFGAVIVQAGKVLAGACNRVLAKKDPTAHAEIEAIREACARAGHYHLPGATIYTTCEPCPMCLAAVHWARIERVVYALTRSDAAALGFIDEDLYRAMQHPRVRMEQRPCPAARTAFSAWSAPPY